MTLEKNAGTGLGVLVIGLVSAAILASVARLAFGIIDGVFRFLSWIGHGLMRLAEALEPAERQRDSWRPRPKARPVRFRVPEFAVPNAASENPVLAALASRAVDTIDILTRRTLRPGDRVFICLGGGATCGATFPLDIRDELRRDFGDRCPACGTTGEFATTILPLRPSPTSPAPVAASTDSEGPAPEPAHDQVPTSSPIRPLAFRTAS
jgi:hypothetical protein